MKIIEEKQNPFLKRREIKMIVEAEKNPSMQEASKIIAEQFKTREDSIAIKQIKGKFGRKTFLIVANVYNSKEDKEKVEPKAKKKEKSEVKKEENKRENKEEKQVKAEG